MFALMQEIISPELCTLVLGGHFIRHLRISNSLEFLNHNDLDLKLIADLSCLGKQQVNLHYRIHYERDN